MTRRATLLAPLFLLTLVLTGCSTEPTPMGFWNKPESDFARILQDLFSTIVLMAGVVFVVVEAILIYAVFRFRRRDDSVPVQTHGHSGVEIAWTIAPALVLAVVAIPTVRAIFESYHPERQGPIAVKVEVVGHQWWWEYNYPDLGITTANEIHFPAGQRSAVYIKSADIIHGFWIPALGGKRDAIPTRTNELWWTPDKPGIYFGQCTQLCGTSHANMRLRAVVHDAAGWQQWVNTRRALQTQAPAQAPPAGHERGYQLVTTGQCIACHAIGGTPMQGKVGPSLTRYGERLTLGAGMFPNDQDHLVRWLKDPQGMKPGNKMPNLGLSDEDAKAIAAYLLSLK